MKYQKRSKAGRKPYKDVITKQELVPEIIEKNYRNTQLTDEQKESNLYRIYQFDI